MARPDIDFSHWENIQGAPVVQESVSDDRFFAWETMAAVEEALIAVDPKYHEHRETSFENFGFFHIFIGPDKIYPTFQVTVYPGNTMLHIEQWPHSRREKAATIMLDHPAFEDGVEYESPDLYNTIELVTGSNLRMPVRNTGEARRGIASMVQRLQQEIHPQG